MLWTNYLLWLQASHRLGDVGSKMWSRVTSPWGVELGNHSPLSRLPSVVEGQRLIDYSTATDSCLVMSRSQHLSEAHFPIHQRRQWFLLTQLPSWGGVSKTRDVTALCWGWHLILIWRVVVLTITLVHPACDLVLDRVLISVSMGSVCFLKLESLHSIWSFWEDSPQKTSTRCPALSLENCPAFLSATKKEKEQESSRQDEMLRPWQRCPGQAHRSWLT